ncbi:MAG: porin [Spirochaetales bacterium]|nr:porin [Spirochaetales bacterium]
MGAFEIESGKHIEFDQELVLGTSLTYEATDFPGRGGFTLTDLDIKMSGTYEEDLEFNLSLDLSELNSSEEDEGAVLKNAYIQYNQSDLLRYRVGQAKLPFGMEYEMSSTERPQLYHSQGSDLIAPGRALGFTLLGKEIWKTLSYKAGLYNFTSSDDSYENDSGHIRAAGTIKWDYEDWEVAYEISGSTAETFAHGVGVKWDHKFSSRNRLTIFMELMEQRYYNYYWNNSLYSCISFRHKRIEPYIYFDYFNEDIDEDGENDIIIPGLGFNAYLIDDKLQIRSELHSEYIYSYPTLNNYKFYDTQLSVNCVVIL